MYWSDICLIGLRCAVCKWVGPKFYLTNHLAQMNIIWDMMPSFFLFLERVPLGVTTPKSTTKWRILKFYVRDTRQNSCPLFLCKFAFITFTHLWAACVAGRLKTPCGQRPELVLDGLCAFITHIKTATGTRHHNNFNAWTVLRLIFVSHFIRPRTRFSIRSFIVRVREAKVHSIFLSDRIVVPSASIVIMASHPRNIFDVIYVDGSE